MRVKDSYYILENTLDGDKDQKIKVLRVSQYDTFYYPHTLSSELSSLLFRLASLITFSIKQITKFKAIKNNTI